jgi:hypothetical protein
MASKYFDSRRTSGIKETRFKENNLLSKREIGHQN